jgi:hypothetical protein
MLYRYFILLFLPSTYITLTLLTVYKNIYFYTLTAVNDTYMMQGNFDNGLLLFLQYCYKVKMKYQMCVGFYRGDIIIIELQVHGNHIYGPMIFIKISNNRAL